MKVARLSALCTGCLYCQEIHPVLISVTGWVDPWAIVWPPGLSQWKIPRTPSRSEPATCWLVARCLNQLCQHITQTPGNYLFTIYLKTLTVTHNTEHCMIGWQCITNCKKACIQSIMSHSQYHLLCLCLEELRDGKKKKKENPRSGWVVSGPKLNLRPPGTEAAVLYIQPEHVFPRDLT